MSALRPSDAPQLDVAAPDRAAVTRTQKVGLVLAGLLAVTSIPSVLFPTPDGETGPPMGILALGTVLGVVATVGVVLAWRGSRRWLRVAAGANVIAVLTSVPALFVDVPMWLKASVGVTLLLTLLSVGLMFSAGRASAVTAD